MLLSETHQDPESLKYHTFDIDEREEIQRLWQEIQTQNGSKPSTPTTSVKRPSTWTADEEARLLQLWNEGLTWDVISKKLGDRSALACMFHVKNYYPSEYDHIEAKKDKLSAAYDK